MIETVLFIAMITLVILISLLGYLYIADSRNKKEHKKDEIKESYRRNKGKERFTHVVDGTLDPTSGAINAAHIYTDQLLAGDSMEFLDKFKKGPATATSGGYSLGATQGTGFDELQRTQTEIQALESRGEDGVQTREDMELISKKIISSANNSNNYFYSRAGAGPQRLAKASDEMRILMPKDVVDYRNRNTQIVNVKRAIVGMPIRNLNPDRIGDELEGISFAHALPNANMNRNKRGRITVAAGAMMDGANAAVIDKVVELDGNGDVVFHDLLTNRDINVPTNTSSEPHYEFTTFEDKIPSSTETPQLTRSGMRSL